MFANEIANQVLSLHQFLFTMRAFSVDAVVDSFHMLPRETFVTPNFNTPTSKILQKKKKFVVKMFAGFDRILVYGSSETRHMATLESNHTL